MNGYILETKNLNKTYGDDVALDNINISLEKGRIYGFIGPNGAGKTTFIRLITGLSYATKGSFSLFGKTGNRELEKERQRIGAIVESPSLYPNMTAYENLEVQRISRGIPDKKAIHRVLDIVSLSKTDKKNVSKFSLGMKQRLGIGIALLNHPEFLLLDEPNNGLDPMGIREIRELLIALNKEHNITILISSHGLGELHQLATDYIIINKGKIVEEITSKDLEERCKRHIYLEVDDVNLAATVFEKELNTTNYIIMPDNKIKLYEYLDNVQRVSSALSQKKILVTQIVKQGESLEDYFINIIGGGMDV